jgi:arylsulfatase A-like enzyme
MSTTLLSRRDFTAAAAAPLFAAPRRRPNFVIITSDDHHYQCFGAAGNPHIRTPNLDRLASRGAFFSNAQISTAQCAPSRGVLMSGLETVQSGLLSNGQLSYRDGIGPTVIEQLRRDGYDTALVGKWHIANQPRECGFARAPLWLRAGSSRYQDPPLCRGLDGKPEMTPGHVTDLFSEAGIDVIRGAKQPFVLWLAYTAPHSPLFAAPKYRQFYEGKDVSAVAPPAHPAAAKPFDWITYCAVITHLDEAIGRVVEELDRTGQWENTYVFFLGDNGFMCGTRGLNGKVVPWEESVRVPFCAAGADVKRGAKSDAPVASIDLPATWMELAGLKPAYRLAGRSLTGLLKTGKGGPDAGFTVWADGRPEALTVNQAVEPYRLVRTRTHKLIVWESRRQALYDIRTDPAEEHDLAARPEFAGTLKKLRGLLKQRTEDTHDPAASWFRS